VPVEPTGLIVVDKPGGMTSHDVVARVRRLARTRRVGHGGTLDPMATGVLVIGVGRATRLLTYVIGSDKVYRATIRLGQSTVTDDAEGDVISAAPADGVDDEPIRAGLAALTGRISQVPSAVSAIKVNGQRSYARVRAGQDVALRPREVTVARLDLLAVRRPPGLVDLDVEVACSSGTYVRALARDLGAALGVGGHLTALRRTVIGASGGSGASRATGVVGAAGVGAAGARAATEAGPADPASTTLPAASAGFTLAERDDPVTLPMPAAAARFFPRRDATADETRILSHGGPLDPIGLAGPYAVFGPDGQVLAIVAERDGRARPEVVLVTAEQVA
jgi:tRNA pseudouridine55 synthase